MFQSEFSEADWMTWADVLYLEKKPLSFLLSEIYDLGIFLTHIFEFYFQKS